MLLPKKFSYVLDSKGTLLFNYKKVFIAYCFLCVGLFSSYLMFNQVVAPYRQFADLGVPDSSGSSELENRKFSDFSNGYIPEISNHLNGARSDWLTLWSNQNEFGRPSYHISGISPAYLPSWVIAQFTDSPWRFITALSLLTCFLAGFFIILFCKESGLAPLAGLIAGTSLAASPLFMYWLTFPMFPAIWCWSAGALWAVTRLAKKPDLIGWSGLAFSVYSLLMTAYPQPVVYHAYILVGYGLYLTYRVPAPVRFVILCLTAIIIGAVLALPVYIDLANVSTESARLKADPSFFTVVLPKFESFTDAWQFVVMGTTPELFGNPIHTDFPLPYDGLSITLLVLFFSIIALATRFKQTWGWWLAIAVLCLFAFFPPLFIFGVQYLGLHLSRSSPLGCTALPLIVLTAYGVDALVKRIASEKISREVIFAAISSLCVIGIGVVFALTQSVSIRWGMLMVMVTVVALLAAQYRKPHPLFLVAALTIVMASISYPLMLHQNPAQIALTSPLIEKIKSNLPDGSRFAMAAPGTSVLPPNLNGTLKLPSVHSYNSLSSKRYQALINQLGGQTLLYGRWNGAIAPDYDSTLFWMSNIGLMLSPTQLVHNNLVYLGEESGIHLHKVIFRMGDSVQITSLDTQIVDPRALPTHIPTKLVDNGDSLKFAVKPGLPSVLVLSQQFHSDWQAQVLDTFGWRSAQTTVINGVFQGVVLPENTQQVRLEFKPYVRYAWLAHIVWISLLFLIALNLLGSKFGSKKKVKQHEKSPHSATHPESHPI